MRSFFLVPALALALLGSQVPRSAEAQITKQGQGYLLRLKFTPGQVIRNRITNTIQMGREPRPMVINIKQTVKSVRNGVATIESEVTMPGQTTPTKETFQVNNRGVPVGGGRNSASSVTFPEGPVRVGQTWRGSVPTPIGAKMESSFTLRSVRRQNNREVAEIAIRLTGGDQSMRIAGQGTMFLLTADGSLLNGTINANMTLTQPRSGQGSSSRPATPNVVPMTMRMERL